ncbi:hypothetical protein LP419_26690 [Massilia sp. H-1]|nr:hypothetical protein LP419_26690 [Massilia sp. H-1]
MVTMARSSKPAKWRSIRVRRVRFAAQEGAQLVQIAQLVRGAVHFPGHLCVGFDDRLFGQAGETQNGAIFRQPDDTFGYMHGLPQSKVNLPGTRTPS